MGRMISVEVSPAKIFADKHLTGEQRALLPLFQEALDEMRVNPKEDSIYLQPGSHPGLLEIQYVWARSKGYKTLNKVPDDLYEQNHLLNLNPFGSECQPQEFKKLKWRGDEPICSSPRLLSELLEIDRTTLKEEERRPYFALLAGTLGSVLGNVPMSMS